MKATAQMGEVAEMVKELADNVVLEFRGNSGTDFDELHKLVTREAAELLDKFGQRWIPASSSVEPTKAMLDAAIVEHDNSGAFVPLRDAYAGIWRAMESARRSEQKDCPHAAPFRYCHTCAVTPCPIGLDRTPPPPKRP